VILKITISTILGIPLFMFLLLIPSYIDTALLRVNMDYWAREAGRSARINQDACRWIDGTYASNLEDLNFLRHDLENTQFEMNEEKPEENAKMGLVRRWFDIVNVEKIIYRNETHDEERISDREQPNITFVFLSASQTGYTYFTEHANGLGKRYYFRNGDKGTEVRFDKPLTWKQWILKTVSSGNQSDS